MPATSVGETSRRPARRAQRRGGWRHRPHAEHRLTSRPALQATAEVGGAVVVDAMAGEAFDEHLVRDGHGDPSTSPYAPAGRNGVPVRWGSRGGPRCSTVAAMTDKIWAHSGDSHFLKPEDLWHRSCRRHRPTGCLVRSMISEDEELVEVEREVLHPQGPEDHDGQGRQRRDDRRDVTSAARCPGRAQAAGRPRRRASAALDLTPPRRAVLGRIVSDDAGDITGRIIHARGGHVHEYTTTGRDRPRPPARSS